MADTQDDLMQQKRRVGIISVVWLGVVTGLFAWQSARYSGIVAILAEWQYRVIGHYYPGITFVLLCLFFSLPLLVTLLILWRTWRHKAKETSDPREIVFGFSRRLQRLTTVLALGAGGVALGSLILSFLQPSDSGQPRRIDAVSVQPAAIVEGRTVMVGPIDLNAVAQFDQQALLIHRRLHFAPMRAAEPGAPPARFFVEVRETPHLNTPFVPVLSGVLKQDSLPGDVRRLYQNSRYPVDETTYLLYGDAERLHWRYRMVAAQLAIVALLLAATAWLESRRRRRIQAKLENGEEAARPETAA